MLTINSKPNQYPSIISTISFQVRRKVSDTLTYLAFRNQFAQIQIIEKFNPSLASLKRNLLNKHIDNLSNHNKLSLSFRLLLEKINLIRLIVMKFIHSPLNYKELYDFFHYCKENNVRRYYDFTVHPECISIEEEYTSKVVESVHFYSDDHQQLNGLMVYFDEFKSKDKPVIILSNPRNTNCEKLLDQAKIISRKNNVNVLLYDARGTGSSLGTLHSLDNAADDCKAAIKYAFTNFCKNDSSKIGIIGYSLGGGVATLGLKKFHEETGRKVGLHCVLRSFSSLYRFFPRLRYTSQLILWSLGINSLNSAEILSKNMANKTVVIRAPGDSLMVGEFCLYNYLKNHPIKHVECYKEHCPKTNLYGEIDNDCDHGSEWDYEFIGKKIQEALYV